MDSLKLELMDRRGKTHCALLDKADEHLLGTYTWRICPVGYVHRKYGDEFIYLHRVIMAAPAGAVVDHINGNRTDNRRGNLRLCTAGQNQMNARIARNNSSGFKGVSWNKDHWIARITVNKRVIYLGSFEEPREAAHAYNRAAIQLHGEFARLNPL